MIAIPRIGRHVSGREPVRGGLPVNAVWVKPAVVAVPVHRVTDPRSDPFRAARNRLGIAWVVHVALGPIERRGAQQRP